MEQNLIIGFLKNVLNFSLHSISKACSGCLVFGQSISLVGRVRDKWTDASISQPTYNILDVNIIRLYLKKKARGEDS